VMKASRTITPMEMRGRLCVGGEGGGDGGVVVGASTVIAEHQPELLACSRLALSGGRQPVGATRRQVSENTCRSRGERMMWAQYRNFVTRRPPRGHAQFRITNGNRQFDAAAGQFGHGPANLMSVRVLDSLAVKLKIVSTSG
jgi:hypothetical protein